MPLRVAAINFLNPAPLMYSFEHTNELAGRYVLNYTMPSQCAADLQAGRADLGLIPIAALTPELAIVPGCTIAALDHVRSIQLILNPGHTLETVRTLAADTASRSSIAYAQILFRHFLGTDPEILSAPADAVAMLAQADAALLIGDPALLAAENRSTIETQTGPCTWYDLAHEWVSRTHLPWVAAVWAVRQEALVDADVTAQTLIRDLNHSREQGMSHIDVLVDTWEPRIAIPRSSIRNYLTQNIYYDLDERCLQAISLFRNYATESEILPPLPELNLLSQTELV